MTNNNIHVVVFQLGSEYYGIDIQCIREVQSLEYVRPIPGTPSYIEGILRLRQEVIPVINLYEYFHIEPAVLSEEGRLLSGFIILSLGGILIALMVDKIHRVSHCSNSQVQAPPQVISGIRKQYIYGVIREEQNYLILLDIISLFREDKFMQNLTWLFSQKFELPGNWTEERLEE